MLSKKNDLNSPSDSPSDHIVSLLNLISQLLDNVEIHLKENNWDMVANVMSRVASFQAEIKNHSPSVESLLEKNPAFLREYEPLKAGLLEKTGAVIAPSKNGKWIKPARFPIPRISWIICPGTINLPQRLTISIGKSNFVSHLL